MGNLVYNHNHRRLRRRRRYPMAVQLSRQRRVVATRRYSHRPKRAAIMISKRHITTCWTNGIYYPNKLCCTVGPWDRGRPAIWPPKRRCSINGAWRDWFCNRPYFPPIAWHSISVAPWWVINSRTLIMPPTYNAPSLLYMGLKTRSYHSGTGKICFCRSNSSGARNHFGWKGRDITILKPCCVPPGPLSIRSLNTWTCTLRRDADVPLDRNRYRSKCRRRYGN